MENSEITSLRALELISYSLASKIESPTERLKLVNNISYLAELGRGINKNPFM